MTWYPGQRAREELSTLHVDSHTSFLSAYSLLNELSGTNESTSPGFLYQASACFVFGKFDWQTRDDEVKHLCLNHDIGQQPVLAERIFNELAAIFRTRIDLSPDLLPCDSKTLALHLAPCRAR